MNCQRDSRSCFTSHNIRGMRETTNPGDAYGCGGKGSRPGTCCINIATHSNMQQMKTCTIPGIATCQQGARRRHFDLPFYHDHFFSPTVGRQHELLITSTSTAHRNLSIKKKKANETKQGNLCTKSTSLMYLLPASHRYNPSVYYIKSLGARFVLSKQSETLSLGRLSQGFNPHSCALH